MKTKNVFILSILVMWAVLAGALSMSAKEFYFLDLNNASNLPIKVNINDGKGKPHEFDLKNRKIMQGRIYGENADQKTYYGFGAKGSKFVVEINDPAFEKFEKEFNFTEGNFKETLELKRKKDTMGIPTSDKVKMKVSINSKMAIHDQEKPVYPKPYVGTGAIEILFSRDQVQ